MSLALITVGTSFREALCWDFDDFDYSVFDQADVTPAHPDVRKLRYEMGQRTKDVYDPGFFKSRLIERGKIEEYTWRYPAEIDTMVQFSVLKPEEFKGIDKISLIRTENEDGYLAANVLKYTYNALFTDNNISLHEDIKYRPINGVEESNSELINILANILNSADEQVFLFVTGGYKYTVLMAGIAFQNSEMLQPKHLIYKHEESSIIIHSENINNTTVLPLQVGI